MQVFSARAWIAMLSLAAAGLASAQPAAAGASGTFTQLADPEGQRLLTGCRSPKADEEEFEPVICELKLPRVLKLQVGKPGLSTDQVPKDEPPCERFRLTPAATQRYLARAGEVSRQDWMHTLDWVSCAVEVQLQFADGRKGRLVVSPTRMGTLHLDGEETRYLYCRTCFTRPPERYW